MNVKHLSPCQSAFLLLFLVGGTHDEARFTAKVTRGDIRLTVRTGNGSQALVAAGPDYDGTAVGVVNLGVGASSYEKVVGQGLVGAVDQFCTVCSGSVQSPDGKAENWLNVLGVRNGRGIFVGPAGRWRWEWGGATYGGLISFPSPSRPFVAAWAPIGNDWIHFRDPRA